MIDAWLPVCQHGMSEDECRAAILEVAAQMLDESRRVWRAAGVPLAAIEVAAVAAARLQAERVERDLPQIMRNLALSAGAATMQ
jgi:anti-sigma-K factor RskA